ncbi:DUF2256 domain-containing protein [Vibrio sp. ZSDZ34]|uniref:DUF2256 domain-containing protein n=1 Tax=Vibrio gelatinilyticus TaxID=2893468 RepID=A0A9X2AU39_9VIBR|nr:DUF2256 domain-containing protein [Vibrio gelatinilyticus]MCJ2375504.1 DUF2256 domain-containing protein [Vibrio gelatinilyticus]
MPKGVRKNQLPQKVCARCARPFRWRKKWRLCWEEVLYCSNRCRNNKNTH